MSNSALFRMKRSVKIGTYSLVMGVMVLAALIVANLLVGALPAKLTEFDASGKGMTEISDTTEAFVSKLSEDVTVYWLCENGAVDEQFRLLLSRYEEAGKHIKVEIVDPLEDAAFTAKYSDVALSPYSLVVESARRYTVLDYTDLYYYTNAAFVAAYQLFPQYLPADIVSPMSAATLESACAQYGSMVAYMLSTQGVSVDDVAQYTTVHSFRGEAKLTSALDYVTRAYIPHAYLLTGHGEAAPSESLGELLDSMGMDAEPLALATSGGIPVDAGCLILFSPTTDLTPHEASLITAYLNGGGSLMLNTSPEVVESCPNLQSVVSVFGLTAAEGLVQEGDTNYISGSQYTLVPSVSTEHSATAYVSSGGFKPRMPRAHAITVAETLPAGVTVTPLFTTSDKANRVSVADNSVTLGTAGKLQVAVAASKSVTTAEGTKATANLTWFASAEAFTDAIAEATEGGNYYYYSAAASLLNPAFTSSYEGLTPVPMQVEPLTVEAGTAWVLGAVTVILIPAGLLTAGIVIWVRRKRR